MNAGKFTQNKKKQEKLISLSIKQKKNVNQYFTI